MSVGNIRFGIFDPYSDRLEYMVSTRHGGDSAGQYSTGNVALHVGDEQKTVVSNRIRLLRQLGYDIGSLVCMEQIHSNKIYFVTERDKGRGALRLDDAIASTDAIVTTTKDIVLCGFSADCSIAMLYDPIRGLLAIVHCGRKGLLLDTYGTVVDYLKTALGSNPGDLLVAVAPLICGDCYDLDETVAKEIRNIDHADDGLVTIKNGKYHVDLEKGIRGQLSTQGVRQDNIEFSGVCTSCNTDDYYSHHRENRDTGRFGVFATLV
uniref:Purine nucleoside phosphorylase n=1 Tax=Candidatus Kentrum sp. SD TaxID=2126332 RepID=A0A450Z144_9GAMM|nr:MAG: conserved hypothetical protein [Candidatus Kentron sp. SD]VFK47504.1 MAG: conserved hypothetical protein [Candidatus Kentron sp. SD]VFK80193.1 MAG: conserved hypothetical protein [Candidatus Kentron sp. SD]